MILLFAILWWLLGVASFIYWWVKEFDFQVENVIPAMLFGVIGPLMWIVGWASFGGDKGIGSKVLIKKRD